MKVPNICACTCTRVGTSVYLFGGSNGETLLNSMLHFDFQSFELSELRVKGQVPSPRSGVAAAAIGNRKIYYYGGYIGGEGDDCSNELFEYSVAERTFTGVGSIRGAMGRVFCDMISFGHQLYMFGGYHTLLGYFGDCWSTDTSVVVEHQVGFSWTKQDTHYWVYDEESEAAASRGELVLNSSHMKKRFLRPCCRHALCYLYGEGDVQAMLFGGLGDFNEVMDVVYVASFVTPFQRAIGKMTSMLNLRSLKMRTQGGPQKLELSHLRSKSSPHMATGQRRSTGGSSSHDAMEFPQAARAHDFVSKLQDSMDLDFMPEEKADSSRRRVRSRRGSEEQVKKPRRKPRRFRQADIDAGLVPPELLLQDAEEAEESPEFPGPKSGEVSPTLTLLVEDQELRESLATNPLFSGLGRKVGVPSSSGFSVSQPPSPGRRRNASPPRFPDKCRSPRPNPPNFSGRPPPVSGPAPPAAPPSTSGRVAFVRRLQDPSQHPSGSSSARGSSSGAPLAPGEPAVPMGPPRPVQRNLTVPHGLTLTVSQPASPETRPVLTSRADYLKGLSTLDLSEGSKYLDAPKAPLGFVSQSMPSSGSSSPSRHSSSSNSVVDSRALSRELERVNAGLPTGTEASELATASLMHQRRVQDQLNQRRQEAMDKASLRRQKRVHEERGGFKSVVHSRSSSPTQEHSHLHRPAADARPQLHSGLSVKLPPIKAGRVPANSSGSISARSHPRSPLDGPAAAAASTYHHVPSATLSGMGSGPTSRRGSTDRALISPRGSVDHGNLLRETSTMLEEMKSEFHAKQASVQSSRGKLGRGRSLSDVDAQESHRLGGSAPHSARSSAVGKAGKVQGRSGKVAGKAAGKSAAHSGGGMGSGKRGVPTSRSAPRSRSSSQEELEQLKRSAHAARPPKSSSADEFVPVPGGAVGVATTKEHIDRLVQEHQEDHRHVEGEIEDLEVVEVEDSMGGRRSVGTTPPSRRAAGAPVNLNHHYGLNQYPPTREESDSILESGNSGNRSRSSSLNSTSQPALPYTHTQVDS